MARLKRSSKVVDKAEKRLAGLVTISPELDLGQGLTAQTFSAEIEKLRQRLTGYNSTLAAVDAANNEILAAEKELADLSEQMLIAVAYKYGKNSSEYTMAGGVAKTRRKRAVRKTSDPIAS
jgi:uncharacterized protein YukE